MEHDTENRAEESEVEHAGLVNPAENANKSAESSFSLSLTPPCLEKSNETKKTSAFSDNSDSSISERLSSGVSSVENDRSYQEIEISQLPNFSFLQNLPIEEGVSFLPQDSKPPSLNSSFRSDDNSIINNSLNALEIIGSINVDNGDSAVKSVLEEILNNEQFKSDLEDEGSQDSMEESLNIFANIDLDDKSITGNLSPSKNLSNDKSNIQFHLNDGKNSGHEVTLKHVKELEELVGIKDGTIAALTSELDSFREMTSNPSTVSLGTSTTEYKQIHENKLYQYQNEIEHKNHLISELTESLKESVANREELKFQVEHFQNELLHIQNQLKETTKMVLTGKLRNNENESRKDSVDSISSNSDYDAQFKLEFSKLGKTMNPDQKILLDNLKQSIAQYCKQKLANDQKGENDSMTHLKKQIRQDLESKHSREMEDLRRYFEKKCSDLEKNYSEEVFSQQSRKMSGSSTASELDLSPDILLVSQNQVGAGGDASSFETYKINLNKRNLHGLSKNDLEKLKEDLSNLYNAFNHYKFSEISDEDLNILKDELGNYDIKNLFKLELDSVKIELQNKYHAELEILREDCENRIDVLNVQHEDKLKRLKDKYLDEIESLKEVLNQTNKAIGASSAIQEVESSGDFEINEVVQSYERRLQEQVTQAKLDIIGALEDQIQRLASNECDDEEWPTELLGLRDKFTYKYEEQIDQLNEDHELEIAKLKEEHLKLLNGALGRAKRKSLQDGDGLTSNEVHLMEERNNFKKQTNLLRHLLGELLKYFTQCEDELNNTLVDELLKSGFEKNDFDESAFNDSTATDSSVKSEMIPGIKRVHLTPNFQDLLNIIESASDHNLDSDVSLGLKSELGACLEKLKTEANAILALTTNIPKHLEDRRPSLSRATSLEEKVSSLTRQLMQESQAKKELKEQINEAREVIDSLENERKLLENQISELIDKLNVTQAELERTSVKMAELVDNGHREMISEGYGEHGLPVSGDITDKSIHFQDLQEQVRIVYSQSPCKDQHLLQLVEQLCRFGEQTIEDTKNEREDLLKQKMSVALYNNSLKNYIDTIIHENKLLKSALSVAETLTAHLEKHVHIQEHLIEHLKSIKNCGIKIDAADKKYKKTCQFLEEQASEREQERDEAQREISSLQEKLRDRDKDRVTCSRLQAEVEHMETQLREMSGVLEGQDKKLKETESEKSEAVEKIFFLRDVIRDLEGQVKSKSETELELRNLIEELECIISQQTESNLDLNDSSDLSKGFSDIQRLQEHICQLEGEVQQLRLGQELVGTEGALNGLKNQLIEIETTIEKRTKDLEELLSGLSTNCSSPSEEMSVRDLVHPQHTTSNALSECEVPLQQLARLKEKLVRHSRAEDAALKRIRDLEMQIYNLKNAIDEYQTERDILKKEISDQLVLISSLQIRLDDQRIRAEHIEKQTNTSLESKIYDLQKEISELHEQIQNRDKNLNYLNNVLEETKRRLSEKETEMSSSSDDEMIIIMQKEIEHLRSQNTLLQKRLTNGVEIIPNLVENIISDKNSDIEILRQKLTAMEQQLEIYTSLNLDKSQITALHNLKHSGTSLTEVISFIQMSSPDQVRRLDTHQESFFTPRNFMKTPYHDQTAYTPHENVTEISSIENVGSSNRHFVTLTPLSKPNSTEINKSNEKRVHFDLPNSSNKRNLSSLLSELEDLREQVESKDAIIKDGNEKLKALMQLEENIDKLQNKLEETQDTLTKVSEKFEKEMNECKEAENTLQIENLQKKLHLEEREEEVKMLKIDSNRKDEMYLSLAREMKNLQKQNKLLEEQLDNYNSIKEIMTEKDKIISSLEFKMAHMIKKEDNENIKDMLSEKTELIAKKDLVIENLKAEAGKLREELNDRIGKMKVLESERKNLQENIQKETENNHKFAKEINNKDVQIETLSNEVDELSSKLKQREIEIEKLQNLAKEQKDVIIDRECELEIMKEDAKKYEEDIIKLEQRLKKVEVSKAKEIQSQKEKLQQELTNKISELIVLTSKTEELNKELVHLQELLKEKDKIIYQFNQDSVNLHVSLETIQNKMQESGNIIDLGKKLRDEQIKNSELLEELHLLKAQVLGHITTEQNVMASSIEEITGNVRRELDYSAHLDSNILNAVGEGSMGSLSGVQDVQILHKAFSDLRDKYKSLNERFLGMNENSEKLQIELEKERFNLNAVQLEDASLIEQLRIQLDNAHENENELERMVNLLRQRQTALETEIRSLKSQLIGSNSKSESTEYKTLPSRELQELELLRREVTASNQEITDLKKENKHTKRSRNELESKLRYNKDLLDLKNKEIRKFEEKLEINGKHEALLREKFIDYSEQLEQKSKEVENSRLLIEEMELERREMKKQLDDLNEKVKHHQESSEKFKQRKAEKENTSIGGNIPISDQLMRKIEEINTVMRSDRKTMDLVIKLTNDNKVLKNRVIELENDININMPFDDPMARANYLFAKYLRVESYRKALVWQKRYLISLLATYQDFRMDNNYSTLPNLQGRTMNRTKYSGIRKFRSVTHVLISVIRMKFLVRRWHTGKRIAEEVNSRYNRAPQDEYHVLNSQAPPRSVHFEVDQFVSQRQFNTRSQIAAGAKPTITKERSLPNLVNRQSTSAFTNPADLPWYGISPPHKENSRVTARLSANCDPLRAPQLLSHYVERCNKIQENLNLMLNSNPSN